MFQTWQNLYLQRLPVSSRCLLKCGKQCRGMRTRSVDERDTPGQSKGDKVLLEANEWQIRCSEKQNQNRKWRWKMKPPSIWNTKVHTYLTLCLVQYFTVCGSNHQCQWILKEFLLELYVHCTVLLIVLFSFEFLYQVFSSRLDRFKKLNIIFLINVWNLFIKNQNDHFLKAILENTD